MFPLFPYRVYNHTAQGHLHLLSQHQERLLTAPALPRGFSSVLTAFDQSLKTVLGTGKRHVECSVEWNVLDSKTVVEKEVIRSLAPPVCAVKRPLLRYLSNTDAGCDLPSIFLRRPFRDDSSQFLECFALDTSRSLARPLAGCETMAGYPLLTPSSIPIYRFQYSGIDVPADVLPPFINSTITEDTFDFAMDSGARELPSAPLAMPSETVRSLQRVVAELLGPTVFPFIDSSCHLHQASPHDIHESPLMPSLSETAEELTLTPRPLQAAETMFGSHATIWRVMNAPKDIVWELETTDIDRKLALTYKDPISLLQLGGGICCPRTLHLPQEPSLISLWVTENTLPSDVLGHYCPCGSAADVLGHCCPCGSAADVLLFPQRVFLERLVPVEGRDPKSPHINPLKRQRRDPTPIPHEESDLQGRFAEPAPTAYPLPVDVEASRSKAAQLIKILEALEGPAQTVELPPVDALEPEDLPEMVVWPKAAWELHLEYSIRKMQELPLGAELMSLCKSSPLECLAALKIAVKHSQDATLHEIAADALSCSVTVLDGGRCVLTPAEVNLPERFSPENALLEDVEAAFMGLMTDVWGAELSLLVLTSALAQQVKGCAAVLSPSENYSRLFRCAWSWWNELTRAMSNRHFVSYASVFQADLTPLRPLRVSPEASQPKTYLSDVPDNCWLVAPSGLQFDLKDRDLFRCARWRVNTWVGTQPAAPCLPVIASPLSGLVDVADDLAEGLVGDAALIGPSCAMLLASKEDFRENFLACSRTFKLVFPVNLGPLECSESLSWLLAEDTASLRDLISQLQQTYLHSEIHASLAKPTDRNNFMHRVALLSGLDLPTDL
ncbi:MAG: uncharacterized protein KVP18_001870 [Porospora cf. gigantea A]|uniref:uncharacterized protein n=1 Tax=Porospora cf. gigantea A TaxID=2853593 RepID=UPI0035593E20|nr:MAG: hypothetical protein KVP18_001870 [Porospora cf. gigantea A]